MMKWVLSEVGLRADLVVINGNHNNPYRAVIDATAPTWIWYSLTAYHFMVTAFS
jgi:hypothetical protein